MKKIFNEKAPDSNIQMDWERQLKTAQAIFDRHSRGINSVVLADEVGMGKTYAALAVIALHLAQTVENNRKVLLIVPNTLLSAKWEQEIRTFNRRYLLGEGAKELRPLVVSGYWELIQNLNDYQNVDVQRISERKLSSFAFWVKKWFDDSQRKFRKRKLNWPICEYLDENDRDVLELTSYFSPLALSNFLEEQISLEPDRFERMKCDLQNDQPSNFLKQLLRAFGKNQDAEEPNVLIVSMSSLKRTRTDDSNAKLFASYIVSRGLKRRHLPRCLKVLAAVDRNNFVTRPEGIAPGKKKHCDWMLSIFDTNLCGFEKAVDSAIDQYGQEKFIEDLLGRNSSKALKDVSDCVVQQKLDESGIVLAVIDEIHNWKNGGNGAQEFCRVFSAKIPKKLMVSATPFELHEDELGRIFSYVSVHEDQSLGIVKNLLSPNGVVSSCLKSSENFQKAWKKLTELDVCELQTLIERQHGSYKNSLLSYLQERCQGENFSAFIESLIHYHGQIKTLQSVLSKIMIRHTKSRDKRHVHAGAEYSRVGTPDYTKSRNNLHPTAGLGDESGALLNYVGMRAAQLVRRDIGEKTNAHLLSGFSSSIKAFQESNKEILSKNEITEETRRYLGFFNSALSHATHPKVAATVERAVTNYRMGSKTLIFCDRLATQEEIVKILRERIADIAFPSGRIEAAKSIRDSVLKDFPSIELYLSRSFRTAFSNCNVPRADQGTIAAEVHRCQAFLGQLSSRRRNKLIDLLTLKAEASSHPAVALIGQLLESESALRAYLNLKSVDGSEIQQQEPIDDDPDDDIENSDTDGEFVSAWDEIAKRESIWHPLPDSSAFHKQLWELLSDECQQFSESVGEADPSAIAHLLLDLGQGLRKILLRLDTLRTIESSQAKRPGARVARMLALSVETPRLSPWHRMLEFLKILNEAQGSIRRPQRHSSRRQSLWKGVYLRNEEIVSELNGSVESSTRISRCAAFNAPLPPDILVCTAIGSEGIDLHLNCDEIILHDLLWNPARFEQRIGRIDRVGSLAERSYNPQKHLLDIGIPFLACDYDDFQFKTLLSRAQKFEILLGKPEFTLDVDEDRDELEKSAPITSDEDEAMDTKGDDQIIALLPQALIDLIHIDLSVASDPIDNDF